MPELLHDEGISVAGEGSNGGKKGITYKRVDKCSK